VADERRLEDDLPELRVVAPMHRTTAARSLSRNQILILASVVIGAFLVWLFALSGVAQHRSQGLLRSRLEAQVAGEVAVPDVPAPGQPIGVMQIPALGVEQVVVEGSGATQTEQGPGHLRESVFPGESGNSVLFGRRTTYGAPFRRIGDLRAGDEIIFTSSSGRFAYQATGAGFLPNDTVDPALGASEDARLTLVTSDPEYLGRQRLVVTAVLAGTPIDPVIETPLGVDSSELGLEGDASYLLSTILAVFMLVATVRMLPRLYSKFPPRAAYLLSTPVLIAVCAYLFLNLGRLLPPVL
jgi:sortase A